MLSDFCRGHDLAALVKPGLPYPAGAQRAAWDAVPMRDTILADGREAARTPYPALPATAFLAYARQGDRQAYEAPYFRRREHLIRTAIAECVEWEEKFLDDVVDGLWTLAEETSWVVSAHNVDAHPGSPPVAERPLPDKQSPVIDLFAAQTAATLTLCCHLLGGPLDTVTPLIRRRMGEEVEQRVLRPFFQRDDFWWMGMIRHDINNWTPWILSNILLCLLYWETDGYRLAEGVQRAAEMLDRYLDTMPADGGCDEGAGYWNMSGASLLDCLELLHFATGGAMDFFQDAKVRNIGSFPAVAHVAGPYFWNFADCDLKPRLDGERLLRFGARTGSPELVRLGRACLRGNPDPWPQDTPQMARVLDRLFAAEPEMPLQAVEPPEAWVRILPDLQVWSARKGRYTAVVKGGHNGENHNHNDVGSFLFFIDGEPAVIDAGNMAYTAKTFSEARYTLWNTRSANHNVPIIAGYEQCAGAACGADAVRMDEAGTSMELQRAYPPESGLLSYVREARLEAAGLRITDEMDLERPEAVQWVFLLREAPQLEPGLCRVGKLALRFPAALRYDAAAYPVTDARLARNFPGEIWRLTLTAEAKERKSVEFFMEGCV